MSEKLFVTPDIYTAIQARPGSASIFATAFGVGVDVINSQVEAVGKRLAEEKARKEREAKREALRTDIVKFRTEVEGFTLPKSLIALLDGITKKAGEMTSEAVEVDLWLDFEEKEDGTYKATLRSNLDTQERTATARGAYSYFHKEKLIEESLTSFVQANYPDSQASKRLKEKKKGLNAWQAIQADGVIKASFTRQPRNQG